MINTASDTFNATNAISQITIGIKKEYSAELESHLKGLSYSKHTYFNDDFYEFSYKSWLNPEDNFVTNFMMFLLNVVKYHQYGFIRISDIPGDVEIHGDLESFDIKYTQEVTY